METGNRIILWIIAASLTLAVFSIIAYANYDHSKELKYEKAYVAFVKIMQIDLDKQFDENLRIKQEYIQSLNYSISKADEDKDGLTYEQELAFGTSDLTPDSDLDGVPDNYDAHASGGGGTHTLDVTWFHNGYNITSQFGIPLDTYLWYKGIPRKPPTDPMYVTYNDWTIKSIAQDIEEIDGVIGGGCLYCTVVDFVQSMLYEYDIDYIGLDEYPKFAIETIVDGKGDCEDTSYLLASLYKALGVDAVLVLLPGHMATAVACDDCSGVYFEHNGKNYFYVETTGGGWSIGTVPEQFKDKPAALIDI
jgi:hypothetical protein